MWRERETETEGKERQEERAGNRDLGGCDRGKEGMEEPDRHFGEGRRLKIQRSAAHCLALSSSLPAHGGRGRGGGGGGLHD